MKKINNYIEKNISKLLSLFIILQPILDSATAVCVNYLKINITIGSLMRIIFLIFCVYYFIFLNNTSSKRKKSFFLLSIFLYFLIYTIMILKVKGIDVLPFELKNTVNTFYILIILTIFLNMFEQYNIKIKIKTIVLTFMLYIALIIIPNMFHLGFLSYYHSKVGNVGWFLSANGVGNILCMLLPFVIYYLLKICSNTFLTLH